jgi:hypothetical protein
VRIDNRLLSMFLFALGGFLGLGATGEIVVALDPVPVRTSRGQAPTRLTERSDTRSQ